MDICDITDSDRLNFLLGRMTERQLNEILGGTYRAIFTINCAKSAINHEMKKVDLVTQKEI